MIKISGLKKYYGTELALNELSFEITQGEIYAIVGHSGAGKSTLLRCINGLEKFDEGEICVLGQKLNEVKRTPAALRSLRRDMGMIFQHFALMERKNVFENVALPLRMHFARSQLGARMSRREFLSEAAIAARVGELLEIVGLASKARAYPRELSGGQKQRVAIARALALRPKILLSDEATSALDPKTTKNILALIKRIRDELALTVVLITHEMEVVKEIADHALLLEHGSLIGEGRVEDLFLRPNEKMRAFLGEEDFLPPGLNIKLYFPKEIAQQNLITRMARELDIDFGIVWGRIEKLNNQALGQLTINIPPEQRERVLDFAEKNGVLWDEVAAR